MFLKNVILWCFFNTILVYGHELVATVIIFRHGARTPRLFHPNDPYKNNTFWPVPVGELTEEGQNQAYELGKWTRQRYQNLLPQKYSSKDFFIYSSGLDRTLMSASLFAAGLYQQSPTSSNIPYQPIPVHSKPTSLDNTILSDLPCPKKELSTEKILESDFFKKLNEDNKGVFEYLSKHMGITINSCNGLHSYYDSFFIEERHNFTLPEWTKEVYPEKLRKFALYNLIARTYSLESTRFRVGSLCSEILAYLTSFSDNTNEFYSDFNMENKGRKILAVSGHDVNISDLLSIFKFPIDNWPSYSSSVIFELKRNSDSNLLVSVLFKNATGLYNVALKDNEIECQLSEFVNFVRPFVMNPNNWKQECTLSDDFSYIVKDREDEERTKYV